MNWRGAFPRSRSHRPPSPFSRFRKIHSEFTFAIPKFTLDVAPSSVCDRPIAIVDPGTRALANQLSHSQVQTLLGSIGSAKGHDIWIPRVDRSGLDWSLTGEYPLNKSLPHRFKAVEPVLSEVDVVWVRRGAGDLVALFEVEHTTSVYSGLLRFNDVHLIAPDLHPRFSVVANDARRSLFVRQVNRPTFQRSGLSEICTFMEYENVLDWHKRIARGRHEEAAERHRETTLGCCEG